MRKTFKILLFCIIVLIFISLDVFAIDNNAYLITTNPGADMSSMVNISWHTKSENMTVEYTKATDTQYANKLTKSGECAVVPFDGKSDTLQCKVTLDNLESDTKYIYRIGNSENYSFKTAGTEEFSFLHITDIHAYEPIKGRTNTANQVISKAYTEFDNMAFTILTGDVTAYGTVYEQWNLLYSMSSTKLGMFAITPGNHDYYNPSAQVTNISYFNSVTNNPDNGANELLNSTYYFKYGNTLFISLNSEASASASKYVQLQQEWFEEVVQNNPSEFIVCFTHRPFYTGDGRNSGQAADSRVWWQGLFDKYGVDLVISGHNHVYARTHQIYNNQVVNEPGEGTIYITGTTLGDRYQESPGPAMPQVAYSKIGKIDGGAVFTVKKGEIDIKLINTSGTAFNDDYTIYSKVNDSRKESFESSIFLQRLSDSTSAHLKYIEPGMGLVNSISVTLDDGTVLGKSYPANDDFILLENMPNNLALYDLNVNIKYRDESTQIKKIAVSNLINNLEIIDKEGKTLVWESSYPDGEVDKYYVLVNNKIVSTVSGDTNSVVIPSLVAGPNAIELRVVNKRGVIINYYIFEYIYEIPEEPIEEPIVDEPSEPDKEEKEKKGCLKKSSSIYSFSLFGLYFIFRRKRI